MSETSSSSSGLTWTVTSQMERTVINEAGAPETVVVITFRLPSGAVGTVNVPAAGYTVAAARAAIAAKASVLDAVAQLTRP